MHEICIANSDELIDAIPSEGSVKGTLGRLDVHHRFEFVIHPPVPGNSILCVFTDDLHETINGAIGRNVTVYGTLHFRAGRPFPEWALVKDIEVHLRYD